MSDTTSRKAVMESIFRRRGANGQYTRLFDDLDQRQQQALLRHVELDSDELPVVGSVESPDRWWMLTTAKMAWCRDGAVSVVAVVEIIDAIADLPVLQATGRSKLEMRELQVKTRRGEQTIEVEAGAPLSGVWSVLKNIGLQNRRNAT